MNLDSSNPQASSEYSELRKALTLAVFAMILISGGLMLFLYRQNRLVSNELALREKQFAVAVTEFKKSKEPITRDFIARLQSFALSYPEFQPVLKKHEWIVRQFAATPAAAPPSMPTATSSPSHP